MHILIHPSKLKTQTHAERILFPELAMSSRSIPDQVIWSGNRLPERHVNDPALYPFSDGIHIGFILIISEIEKECTDILIPIDIETG